MEFTDISGVENPVEEGGKVESFSISPDSLEELGKEKIEALKKKIIF